MVKKEMESLTSYSLEDWWTTKRDLCQVGSQLFQPMILLVAEAAIESFESVRNMLSGLFLSIQSSHLADYESLVPVIYPETESVSAFGGEELDPPSFGKVFVSIKPLNGVYLSSNIKENIQRDLRKYSVLELLLKLLTLNIFILRRQ